MGFSVAQVVSQLLAAPGSGGHEFDSRGALLALKSTFGMRSEMAQCSGTVSEGYSEGAKNMFQSKPSYNIIKCK